MNIEKIKLVNDPASYVLKYVKESINIEEVGKLEKLGNEIDSLAENENLNEKIAINLRAIDVNQNPNMIIDCSNIVDKDSKGNLLKSESLYQAIKEYENYIAQTLNSTYDKNNLIIDVVVFYYPLDKENKIENISRKDKFIVECTQTGNSINHKFKQ